MDQTIYDNLCLSVLALRRPDTERLQALLVTNTCRAVRHAKPYLEISHSVQKAETVPTVLESVFAPSKGELELKVTSCERLTQGAVQWSATEREWQHQQTSRNALRKRLVVPPRPKNKAAVVWGHQAHAEL